MLAPRGINAISIYDEDFSFLAKYRFINGQPLWCEGDRIHLLGGYSGELETNGCGSKCNVMRVKPTGEVVLMYEKSYGSSGGIED